MLSDDRLDEIEYALEEAINYMPDDKVNKDLLRDELEAIHELMCFRAMMDDVKNTNVRNTNLEP